MAANRKGIASTPPAIRSATAQDGQAVHQLLRTCSLPTDGVAEWLESFVLAHDQQQLLGVAGLELYGTCALLRSVGVDSTRRGSGIGRLLVSEALERARSRGVESVYLLTTSAERYFTRLGFRSVDRDSVPAAIRSTVEFREACPASATVMCKVLTER